MLADLNLLTTRTLNEVLCDLILLKGNVALLDTVNLYLEGDFKTILQNSTSQKLYRKLCDQALSPEKAPELSSTNGDSEDILEILLTLFTGLAAFDAFLQANVTGPPLDLRGVFPQPGDPSLRESLLKTLDIDGVSVYQYIPHVELFCLARMVFIHQLPHLLSPRKQSCQYMRVRINAYHQRLLSGMSGGKLSDSMVLQDAIERDLKELDVEILGPSSKFETEAKVQYVLEKAQIYIMQGLDMKAKENVKLASQVAGFTFVLSGALGRRTKFQQFDISQLVVFAKSRDQDSLNAIDLVTSSADMPEHLNGASAPAALDLNDDTLLESISFTKISPEEVNNTTLPPELSDLKPDTQPQLHPLDQITLLTEATIKDTYSPLDKLNSEEILPYAVRVLSDKPANWSIYTQALLIRSRIEAHRSRTQERSVLQLQAIVDQVIADTQDEFSSTSDGIPEIKVTSFLPKAKPAESAPAQERLKYIHPLASPTRWEIETELAYAWSGAGSLLSALEIFKRLRLWAEVALCYHSVNEEEKARQIIRKQLYYSEKGRAMDQYDIDAPEIAGEKWKGEMRPTPPHAPRLWCILGDLDQDPSCWERAWEISKHRYARAQRTLGEYHITKGDLEAARDAYMKATVVNRQNNDSWSRLGDIDLRVGNWDGAIIAFQQSIMIDDTDAKTYSNLGSALLSKYSELISLEKAVSTSQIPASELPAQLDISKNPKDILNQALIAYKRGASLAYSNWQIWDNVITIAARMTPPSFPSLLLGLRNVIRIRAPTQGETAIDISVLRLLISEVTTQDRPDGETENGIFVPKRGTLARAVLGVMDEDILPLITRRHELWLLAEKVAFYRRAYSQALEYAEKAWRLVSQGPWETEDSWREAVATTENLVSAYENYGPMEKGEGEGQGEMAPGWRVKARIAVRGVRARGKEAWEETEGWRALGDVVDGLSGS